MNPKFDLNLLRIVVALHEQRSVSRVAEKLGMSQPTVSAALSRLRHALADPLFVRTSRGMEPTPRVLELIGPAREALQQIDERILSERRFEPATTRATFTLAMTDYGEMVFLPGLIEQLRTQAPFASVRSVTLNVESMVRGMESGAVDLAIGYIPEFRHHNFFQQRLFTSTFACLVRADHPLAGDRVNLTQYRKLKHASVVTQGRFHEAFETFLLRHDIQREVVVSTAHFSSLPLVLACSDLIVTIPRNVAINCARLTPQLKVLNPTFELPFVDVKQHWHKRFHRDPRRKWLRTAIAGLYDDEAEKSVTH